MKLQEAVKYLYVWNRNKNPRLHTFEELVKKATYYRQSIGHLTIDNFSKGRELPNLEVDFLTEFDTSKLRITISFGGRVETPCSIYDELTLKLKDKKKAIVEVALYADEEVYVKDFIALVESIEWVLKAYK